MVNGPVLTLTTIRFKHQYLRPKQAVLDEKFSNMKLK